MMTVKYSTDRRHTMSIARALWLVFPLAALGCGASKPSAPAAASQPPTVTVTKVTYEELDRAVAGHRGQVVLIDVWFRA